MNGECTWDTFRTRSALRGGPLFGPFGAFFVPADSAPSGPFLWPSFWPRVGAPVGDAGALPFRLVAIRVADAFVMWTVGVAGAFSVRQLLPVKCDRGGCRRVKM
jgi:hypothetical protein